MYNEYLGEQLLQSVQNGSVKKILKFQEDLDINFSNSKGETVLHLATNLLRKKTVKTLLKFGADPNRRDNIGKTPVHKAILIGSLSILKNLIEAGGSLQFHDYNGNLPKDYAKDIPNPIKRQHVLTFIEENRLCAMEMRSKFKKKFKFFNRLFLNKFLNPSFIFTGFRLYPSISTCLENELTSCDSEYKNGGFTQMEKMMWCNVPVTVRSIDPYNVPMDQLDVLISDYRHLSQLRHPFVVTLLAVCPISNWDSIKLILECVEIGSLYHWLHIKHMKLTLSEVCILMHSICSACIFLHQLNKFHCCLTSHSIQLTQPRCAKLSNFEYLQSLDNKELIPLPEYAYNWLAPEVLTQRSLSVASEFYSFCCILWEMFVNCVPWIHLSPSKIINLCEINELSLPPSPEIPSPFDDLFLQVFISKPEERYADFVEMRLLLDSARYNESEKASNSTYQIDSNDIQSEERIIEVYNVKENGELQENIETIDKNEELFEENRNVVKFDTRKPIIKPASHVIELSPPPSTLCSTYGENSFVQNIKQSDWKKQTDYKGSPKSVHRVVEDFQRMGISPGLKVKTLSKSWEKSDSMSQWHSQNDSSLKSISSKSLKFTSKPSHQRYFNHIGSESKIKPDKNYAKERVVSNNCSPKSNKIITGPNAYILKQNMIKELRDTFNKASNEQCISEKITVKNGNKIILRAQPGYSYSLQSRSTNEGSHTITSSKRSLLTGKFQSLGHLNVKASNLCKSIVVPNNI